MSGITRRTALRGAFAIAAAGLLPSVSWAARGELSRSVHFYNTHTGEALKTTYWEEGQYIPGALQEINHVLRDHRTGTIHVMDPHLMDLLAQIHVRLDSNKPFEVISGYRSPQSNAMLHERSHGVASHSMHMEGRAIDVRLTDRSLSSLRDTALAMQQGGVGYYPSSEFVHVDTGRVRRW